MTFLVGQARGVYCCQLRAAQMPRLDSTAFRMPFVNDTLMLTDQSASGQPAPIWDHRKFFLVMPVTRRRGQELCDANADGLSASVMDRHRAKEFRKFLGCSASLSYDSREALWDKILHGRVTTTEAVRLRRDGFWMNHHRALAYCLRMIFSENRDTLCADAALRVRIMLWSGVTLNNRVGIGQSLLHRSM
jgi:hypothetical protein